MYLKPQIHGTQDTLTIHVGYIGIHRDTYKDTYLEPYLRPSSTSGAAECWSWPTAQGPNGWPHRCAAHDDGIKTFPQPPRYVSRMYPACILQGSRMYLDCILIATEDTCIPHVSRMYPACIPHVAFVSDTCILILYPGVSWCIVMKNPRYMYPNVSWHVIMYPVWHQGSAQDTCILMYLMCIPKCILDSFGIRVKYMQNIKIHVFSWNVTGHLGYIWDTSGYIRDTCILQDTCRIHHNTSGYVSW